MSTTHVLGYPRIGARRELKRATEAYWKGEIDQAELERTGRELRARHWQAQRDAGLDWVTVGDFAFYDHVLNVSALLGAVPRASAMRARRWTWTPPSAWPGAGHPPVSRRPPAK